MPKQETITKARFDAANTVRIAMKLNRRTDAPILARLQGMPSMSGYIRQLILEDIRKNAPDILNTEPFPKSETGQQSLGKATPKKGEYWNSEEKKS